MQTGWHREDIRAAVRKRGKTLSRLALDSRLEPSACRVALCRRHWRGETAIAAFLEVPVQELWPERWNPDGSRKNGRGNASRKRLVRQRKNGRGK